MAEDVKGTAVLEEAVARVLELQSKYGMDQETMLIYMCSVNLTSILNLIGKRYHGSSSGYIQSPVTAPTTVPAPAPVSATGGNPSPNDLAGMLTSLLGGQGGSGGQGFNPAMLMSLLSALGGQNMDLGNLMNMLAGLMGTGSKNNTKTESSKGKPAASKDASNAAGAAKNDQGGEKQTVREMPKIMKWDNLDQRKRAQS
ncbi:hypothetical protein [Pelotomaculum sp. PtaB.Bin117]|uniref:hypothetical protein n=1 Tax=Pelotomaculum sp. PtaB.Bin117 TaxID=1811694 RepID=UPI0009CD0259|nr:hypothetical protein [Pelotomaculum sp. PtaB.Bin117]OPX84658.1 MAG: hypothetical protein A4E54_02843 [Pelotomaculum sp. PtaB.Bin117]